MGEYTEMIKVGNFLYGNVQINIVEVNEAEEYLRIQVCTPEHEKKWILYHEVYYSQIDRFCQGMKLSMAEEITISDLLSRRYELCYEKFCKQSYIDSNEFVYVLVQRGYRLFMHYTQSLEEYLVIARRVIREV